MYKKSIILIGAGGHCRSCIDVIEQEGSFEICGVVERPGAVANRMVSGYPIIGTDDELANLRKRYSHALVSVGQIKTPNIRERLFKLLLNYDFTLPVIVSPLAYVSRTATVGRGSIVMHHALVNAGAVIGANCIINSKALIEHDVVIEDNCHIATGALVNGQAIIKKGTFIGSNTVCFENAVIGPGVIIGAGLRVKRNV